MSASPFVVVCTPDAAAPRRIAAPWMPSAEPAVDATTVDADARLLVIVEHPAIALAIALQVGDAADPLRWLAQWNDGALRLQRVVQGNPSRCLLVDGDEVLRLPTAFARCIESTFHLVLPSGPSIVVTEAPDALSVFIAETIAQSDHDAGRTYAALRSGCVPLAETVARPSRTDPSGQAFASAVAARLQELHRRLPLAEPEGALAAERDELRRDLATSRLEGELLVQQLETAQKELEAILATQGEVDAKIAALTAQRDAMGRDAADALAKLADAEKLRNHAAPRLEEAEAALAASRAELARVERQHEEALADHRAQTARVAELMQELSDAQEDNRDLLVQMQQMQRELETYFLRCREFENAQPPAAMTAVSEGSTLPGGSLVPAGERDEAPHRELSFVLQQPRQVGQPVAFAALRLVEHHGRPGLVVFEQEQGAQLISAWCESGREHDRAYMLLVPGDDHGRQLLDALRTSDWLRLQSLVSRIAAHLDGSTLASAPRWRGVARRLRAELAELPPKFRCDEAAVEPAAEGLAGTLALRFQGVHCGVRQLPRLSVSWVPTGTQAGIALFSDPDDGPPLQYWPRDHEGAPAARVWLPLGAEVAVDHKRAMWQGLPSGDKEFLLSMLGAWPALLPGATSVGRVGAGIDLAGSAQAMWQDAQDVLKPPPQAHSSPSLRRAALSWTGRWLRLRPSRQGTQVD